MGFLDSINIQNVHPTIDMGTMIACGQYGTAEIVHKMGFNGSITGANQEDMWTQGAAYEFPATGTYPGAKLEVISGSADDDGSPAGTGVQTVKIGYLDGSGVQKSETVTLNGTTAVQTTATDIWRINSFRAASVGTGGVAAGAITLQELDGAPVFSSIAAGQTRARNMAYTVPYGKALLIHEISTSSAAATIEKAFLKFTLRGNLNEGAKTAVGFDFPLWEGVVAGTGWQVKLEEPIYVPALVDLHMVVIGNAATDAAAATAEWRGYLVSV